MISFNETRKFWICIYIQKKQYNKKLFSLNWNKIEEEFYKITTGFLDIKDDEAIEIMKSINKSPKQHLEGKEYKIVLSEVFKNPDFIALLKDFV